MLPAARFAAAVLGCMAASALALGARARAGEWVEQAGARLPPEVPDAAGVLHLNGLPLRVKSGATRQSVRGLLDGFEMRCGLTGGARPLAQPGALPALDAAASELLRPVLRGGGEHDGYAACLDLRARELAPLELWNRVRAFAAGGDLAALGDLRFVWARRERDETAYVAVWTEGSVRLGELFPAHGDAPGMDLPGVPRPPRARRVLSAWRDPGAAMLATYRVELAPRELAARYRGMLIDGGFAVRDGGGGAGAPRWLLAARHGAFTAIALQAAGPSRTLVTLLPVR